MSDADERPSGRGEAHAEPGPAQPGRTTADRTGKRKEADRNDPPPAASRPDRGHGTPADRDTGSLLLPDEGGNFGTL
jgi:hypothetical protein